MTFDQVMALKEPGERYLYAHQYFHLRAPQILRDHRRYFLRDGRGFGEDAFHAMWFLLMLEKQPARMLEIGVFRGQTISLWALVDRYFIRNSIEVHGVSPLNELGDEVSKYRSLDYRADIAANFCEFGLRQPAFTPALSTDPEGVATIRSGGWDVIYIDGGHDRDVVEADYLNARAGVSDAGLIVFDDAALHLGFDPPPFATAGHPGPSDVIRDVVSRDLTLIGSVGHNVIFRADK